MCQLIRNNNWATFIAALILLFMFNLREVTNVHIGFKQILSFLLIVSASNKFFEFFLKYLMLQLIYHETDAILTQTLNQKREL